MFLVLIGLLIWSVISFFNGLSTGVAGLQLFLLIAYALIAIGSFMDLFATANTNYHNRTR